MSRSKLINIALVAMLVAGIGLLLYPTVSDWWNTTRQSHAVAAYVEATEEMDTSQQESMLKEAREYNTELGECVFNGTLDDVMLERYNATLDVTGTGIMGYVKIPSLNCSLPIYHGTDEAVLQVAVGHLEWTSLPVGGEGTHCVISGHRGLPSAKLFTDLDKLVEGDLFMLRVLDETLTYEVDQIRIVEPDEIDDLEIIEGEDYCTLVTCTPYGINSHRLLVRGHRVDNVDDLAAKIVADAILVDSNIVAICIAGPVLAVLFIGAMACGGRKRE